MKNITRSIIALFAVLTLSCSVEDVQDRPVIEGVDAPVLTAPTSGAAYVLTPANAASQVERFTWKSANFGGDVQVNYVVQMDTKGNAFKTPQIIGSALPSENQVSVTVESMNGAALTLKAVPFSPAEMEVRIKATVGTASLFSNVVSIVVTPYTTESPKLWVPGGYAEAAGYPKNWDPASSPKLAASGYGKVDFEGYIYFNDANAEYKFTSFPAWSQPGEYAAGATAGTLALSGANLKIPAAGYYKMEVDTEKLTYKATKLSWGIVGNGTPGGWTTDTPMTYNKDTKTWTVVATLTNQAAPDNGMKFRANNNWDYNFGDTGADGTLEAGGTNISTTAGSYLITLDLSNPRAYKYSMVKQ
ncbi:SusE domain-containing protein [Flavobacterium muglaense]|uniref:SusE domain-containing protein n=1 Tax=Flavobacterium muglaense TaxID=2764716 RepID=A0A923SF60_9FLAO|nr:SusE domain-containing protein [Flavobacterium muglaense]MBC5836890.1 SusE domain-containing protein [Flavobacterium muglaense]MBC5843419.1 SusE domain-containing protein [Flavobacterium muglaense]